MSWCFPFLVEPGTPENRDSCKALLVSGRIRALWCIGPNLRMSYRIYRILTVALTLLAASGSGFSAIARESRWLAQDGAIAQLEEEEKPQPQPSQGIQQLQNRLAQLGYYDGPVDGIFNAATRDALAAFQRENGLVGTGILDPITQQRLASPPSETPSSPPTKQELPNPAPVPQVPPSPTAAPTPFTQPESSTPLDPIPQGNSPEALIEAEEGNSAPGAEEGESPRTASETTPDASGAPTSSDDEALNINPEATEPPPVPANAQEEPGLVSSLLLGLVIMMLGGLGTGLILWLAKRGDTQATSTIDNDWKDLETTTPPAQPQPLHSTAAANPPPSPLRQQHRQPATTTRDDAPSANLESQILTFDMTPEPRVAKINIIDELIQDLENPDPATRHKAIWELGQRGNSAAAQPLTRLLVEADSHEQGLILAALSEISIKTLKPMNRAVAMALQDDNPEVRKNAIRDLTRIYDSLGQVGRMLGHATADSDPEVRQTAHWALDQLNHMRLSANESAGLLQEGHRSVEPLPEDGSTSR